MHSMRRPRVTGLDSAVQVNSNCNALFFIVYRPKGTGLHSAVQGESYCTALYCMECIKNGYRSLFCCITVQYSNIQNSDAGLHSNVQCKSDCSALYCIACRPKGTGILHNATNYTALYRTELRLIDTGLHSAVHPK